jgi:HEAT repeat protein
MYLIRATIASLLLLGTSVLTAATDSPPPETPQARVARLIEKLGDARFRVREAATKELIAIGRPALPALRKALSSADPDIRLRARMILGKIKNSVPGLIEDLGNKDAAIRREAAVQLGRLGTAGKEAAAALVKALKDADPSVREAAAMALEAVDPDNKALAGLIPAKAHVNRKYAKLLRKIKVPQDRQSYGDFRDYGQYQATDYYEHKMIPAGYWVYVYPHWYIWGELRKP